MSSSCSQPFPDEGVELLQEQVPKRSLLTMLGDERPQA